MVKSSPFKRRADSGPVTQRRVLRVSLQYQRGRSSVVVLVRSCKRRRKKGYWVSTTRPSSVDYGKLTWRSFSGCHIRVGKLSSATYTAGIESQRRSSASWHLSTPSATRKRTSSPSRSKTSHTRNSV